MPNLISLVCVAGSHGPAFHAIKITSHLLHSVHLLSSLSKRLSYTFPDDADTFISVAFAYGYDVYVLNVFSLYYFSAMFGIEIEGGRNTVFQTRGRDHVNKEEDVTEKCCLSDVNSESH